MVRLGVIGTNWITERFISAAAEVNNFELAAVYSRTQEKADEFAAKYGLTHTYTDLETFAASKEIDAVYIASPNSMHAAQAILCMNQGKHVLVEKSIASNTKEVKKMIDAAKENKVLLMEAIKTTYLPNFKAIQDNLYKIGRVRRYFASYCQYSSRYDKYKEGIVLNAFNPEYSNGSLMDIGVYCIYPLVKLFGRPHSLKANSFMLHSGVDGQGSIIFNYGECDATVLYSKISNSYLPSEIQGENGSIIMNSISEPTHVEIRYKDGTVEDISRKQHENTMYYEAKEFIELIAGNKTESEVNTLGQSLATAEVLEEARRQIGLVFPADQD